MKRILITGAKGFTGQHLLDRLANEGHEIHGLAHEVTASPCHPELVKEHIADLRELSTIERIVAEVQPQQVVHLAAIAFVAHGDARELYSSNILGTRNLLQALANSNHPLETVLLASSANVYGNQREGILDESMPPEPANDYGITKLTCEMLSRLYAERLPIVTVRPFNYTGRGQSEQFIVPKIVAHSKARRPVIELGNIEVARDFSDVRAVVDVYARLLNAPAAIGGLYNVCSGEARSLRDIIDLVKRLSGHHMDIEVNPAFVRADEVKVLCGSRARLESVIGPLDMPAFEDTIRWMLDDE